MRVKRGRRRCAVTCHGTRRKRPTTLKDPLRGSISGTHPPQETAHALSVLDDVLKSLPTMLDDQSSWDSLIVNRRKPTTHRVSVTAGWHARQLYTSSTCSRRGISVHPHPHPWPDAFTVLEGSYRMWVGFTLTWNSREPDHRHETVLTAGSLTRSSNRERGTPSLHWRECWTVMVNGRSWREKAYVARADHNRKADLGQDAVGRIGHTPGEVQEPPCVNEARRIPAPLLSPAGDRRYKFPKATPAAGSSVSKAGLVIG